MSGIKNTFTVVVQKGKGLRAADLNGMWPNYFLLHVYNIFVCTGKSDPYAVVGWGNDPVKQRKKTPVKNATLVRY
jgi:hypothetical protein